MKKLTNNIKSLYNFILKLSCWWFFYKYQEFSTKLKQLFETGKQWQSYWKDTCLVDNNGITSYFAWILYSNYFKSVYCWNGQEQKLPKLDIDKDGNVKVINGE